MAIEMKRKEDRSLGDLFSDLSGEVATLARKEVDLARTEMRISASRLVQPALLVGAGAAIVFAGFLTLLAAAVFGLAFWLTLWGAALAVGLFTAAVGGGLAFEGIGRVRRARLKPQQTINTIRENKTWLRELK